MSGKCLAILGLCEDMNNFRKDRHLKLGSGLECMAPEPHS